MERVKKQKEWYERWWGSLIIISSTIVLIFFFALVHEYVTIIDGQRTAQLYRSLEQLGVLDLNSSEQEVYTAEKLTDDDPILGSVIAPVTIIEFGDFQCPFCKRVAPTVQQIAADYADSVSIQFRDFPLEQAHPQAVNAALAAACAHEQGAFWGYHDRLYETQSDFSDTHYISLARDLALNTEQFLNCYETEKYRSEVLQDFEEGRALGVTGTPTFFINGSKVSGVISYEQFAQIIEELSTQN